MKNPECGLSIHHIVLVWLADVWKGLFSSIFVDKTWGELADSFFGCIVERLEVFVPEELVVCLFLCISEATMFRNVCSMFNIMNIKCNGISVYSIWLNWVASIPEGFELGMFFGTQKQGYHLKVASLKMLA